MARTVAGGYERGPLPELEPLLRTWVRLQRKYCTAWEWDDVSWYYNERASLSLFAAAVWMSGGVALEEYSTEKYHTPLRSRRLRPYMGRSDLGFRHSRRDFIAEAKPA